LVESILIKDIDIIFADEIRKGDIFLKNGKIQALDWYLNIPSELMIKGSGLTAMAGLIDSHVHFREPGFTEKEDFITGSKAAAKGGVTSIFEMPNTNPATTTIKLLEQKKIIAAQKSLVNYNFFLGATVDNLTDLLSTKNIPGIKLFLGSAQKPLLLNNLEALEILFSKTNKLIAVHAELPLGLNNTNTHSLEEAINGTKLVIELAQKYQKRIHLLHISSKEELEIIEKAKTKNTENGFFLTVEVTPQHLLCNTSDPKNKKDPLLKINPPIREKNQQIEIYKSLKKGVIDTIATDHAPHLTTEKLVDYNFAPSGMPGLETLFPLLLNEVNQKKLTLFEITKLLNINPAKIFKIKNKGLIKENYDADLVILDLKTRKKVSNENLVTKCSWSYFNGLSLQGWPIMTIVNGNLVYREGDFLDAPKGKEITILD
jgi:dihydroorotase